MSYEDVRTAVLNLDKTEQKRLIMEVLPEIMSKVCTDEECLSTIRNFVNKETNRTYKEQHMNGI